MRTQIGAVLCPALVALSTLARADAPPPAIVGTWDVVDVLPDRQNSMGAGYRAADPRLVGRTLTIEQGKVRLTSQKQPNCVQKNWPRFATQWGPLFRSAFARGPWGGRSVHPTIEDFGLSVPATTSVTAYSLCPSPKDAGKKADGIWVIPYQKDELLYRAAPEYLLRVHRRPANAPPTAGTFDCSMATTPTEKVICGDYELAAWDRSVAMSNQLFLKAWKEKEVAFRQNQAQFIKGLNACGTHTACIEGEMSWRVEQIVNQFLDGVGI